MGIVRISSDTCTGQCIKWITRAVIEIELVDLAIIPSHDIYIAVPVYIRNGNCVGIVRISSDGCTGQCIKRIIQAVIEVEFVSLTIAPCHQIQVSISVNVAQRD